MASVELMSRLKSPFLLSGRLSAVMNCFFNKAGAKHLSDWHFKSEVEWSIPYEFSGEHWKCAAFDRGLRPQEINTDINLPVHASHFGHVNFRANLIRWWGLWAHKQPWRTWLITSHFVWLIIPTGWECCAVVQLSQLLVLAHLMHIFDFIFQLLFSSAENFPELFVVTLVPGRLSVYCWMKKPVCLSRRAQFVEKGVFCY